MRWGVRIFMVTLAVALSSNGMAQPAGDATGVDLGKPSAMRNLVPAAELERAATAQYDQLKQTAARQGALAGADNAQLQRLRAIAQRLLPQAPRWNPRAAQWNWEINLIGSSQINAFCMPGGKIAFYTGILDQLRLNDDEIAMVMGHEISHALREHSRERLAKEQLTQMGAGLVSSIFGLGDLARMGVGAGAQMLSLRFSREDETEADLVGLDIAARAGFDPRAAVSLWRKMGEASKGAPPQWLSTHPSGNNRIAQIQRQLPRVLPLYAEAKGTRVDALAPYAGQGR